MQGQYLQDTAVIAQDPLNWLRGPWDFLDVEIEEASLLLGKTAALWEGFMLATVLSINLFVCMMNSVTNSQSKCSSCITMNPMNHPPSTCIGVEFLSCIAKVAGACCIMGLLAMPGGSPPGSPPGSPGKPPGNPPGLGPGSSCVKHREPFGIS